MNDPYRNTTARGTWDNPLVNQPIPPYPNQTMPMPQYTPPVPPQQPQTNQNGIDYGMPWVQGVAAAKAYPVRWGTTVPMMDSETYPGKKVIIFKRVDQNGMPQPLEAYELKPIQLESEQAPVKSEIDLSPIMKRLDAMESRMASIQDQYDSMNSQRRRRDNVSE